MTIPLLVVAPISSGAGFQIQPFSDRNIKQSLDEIEPVGGKVLRRAANGGFVDLTQPQFRLLRSTITYSDFRAPVFNGSWRGAVVQVSCVARRWLVTGGTPDRPLVPTTSAVDEGNGYSWFLPYLVMRVMNATLDYDHWRHTYSGKMELEENAPAA